jgi:hypothetical protein
MSAVLSSTGLEIDTQAVAFDARVDALATELGLTAAQRETIRRTGRNGLHVLCRLAALSDVAGQEALLGVYRSLSWYAEGVYLERVVGLLGATRRAAQSSTVSGQAIGTAATVIPDGTRLRYNPTGSTWAVDGAAVIGGGGEVTITIVSESEDADEVDLDPDGDFEDWTILDTVTGWSDQLTPFQSVEQSVVGAPVETDAALRARAAQEAYRRGQGPLLAIEAAVAAVTGVVFVRAYENVDDATDADGIPSRSINVVVDGGAEADVVAAILASRPAGIYIHGTDHVVVEDLGSARTITVRYDDVAEIDLWIRATIATSTSEVEAAADIVDQCEELLLAGAEAAADIGRDVLPRRLAALLDEVDGFDSVTIELSDDGATWQTSKWEISIRERPSFDAARVSVIES